MPRALQQTISPIDGSVYAEFELASDQAIDAALQRLYEHPERFGLSETTGDPIPFERLDIIPWARTGAETS